jgi:hypothetical protein
MNETTLKKFIKATNNGDIGVDNDGNFYFDISGIEIKRDCMLEGVTGRGKTLQDAIEDYFEKIKGEMLVLNAESKEYRKEFIIMDLK